jgi:ferredoxin
VKATVNGELCTGHGRCYSLAPEIFEPDDEGYSARRDTPLDIAPDDEELVQMAVKACPEGAISLAGS